MNGEIKRIILITLWKKEGMATWPDIKRDVEEFYSLKGGCISSKIIDNNVRLLIGDRKIIQSKSSFYIYFLTPEGYREFDIWYKKFWRFVMWERHNLFSILAILISLAALIVSIVSLLIRF